MKTRTSRSLLPGSSATHGDHVQRRTLGEPRTPAQHSSADGLATQLQTSSRMSMQRQQIAAAFGPAVQREAADEELQMKVQPGIVQRVGPEEELLQGKFEVAQRAGVEDEELVQGRFAPGPLPAAQLQAGPEEELVQGKFGVAQRAGVEDEELVQGRFAPGQMPAAQLQAGAEEELVQGRFAVAQRAGVEDEELVQGRFNTHGAAVAQAKAEPNQTGMPNSLKAGIESLSGMDMSAVRVHSNSDKPAQLNALAYAQGNDIHLGPGQEQHLPHEAWHVVQQAQGRVAPTTEVAGAAVNDDVALESEADSMGAKALATPAASMG